MNREVILMKVTSRGRYDKLKTCVTRYFSYANDTKNMFWLFTIDEDDETFDYEDFRFFLQKLGVKNFFIPTGSSNSKIHAVNRDIAYLEAKWDILLSISDDQLPIVFGYDDLIRDKMPDSLDCSIWFNDGHQDEINTQEILGYTYYKNQGYVYYPEYKSFFCDNEATIVAEKSGKLVKSPLSIIQHFHPVWGANEFTENDALYQRNDSFWEHDQNLFNQRKNDGKI